jgi:hypothetical protein
MGPLVRESRVAEGKVAGRLGVACRDPALVSPLARMGDGGPILRLRVFDFDGA